MRVCVDIYPPGTHVHWEGSIIILPINKIMCSSYLKGNLIILELYHHWLIHVIYNPLLRSMQVGLSSTANWQAVWYSNNNKLLLCVMPCKGGSIISNIGVPLMDLFLAHAWFYLLFLLLHQKTIWLLWWNFFCILWNLKSWWHIYMHM